MNNIPKIPVGKWVDGFVTYLNESFEGFFGWLSNGIEGFTDFIVYGLMAIPALLLIVIVAAIAWFVSRSWSLPSLSLAGLLFILNLGYWEQMIDTLSLVLTSVIISVIIGVPLGIIASQNDTFSKILTPILDLMQTMPAFVYLIPAILFLESALCLALLLLSFLPCRLPSGLLTLESDRFRRTSLKRRTLSDRLPLRN